MALVVSSEPRHELIALDDALNALAAFDLRKSQVVEMRFFGGLSVEETAEALHVSADTVMRLAVSQSVVAAGRPAVRAIPLRTPVSVGNDKGR